MRIRTLLAVAAAAGALGTTAAPAQATCYVGTIDYCAIRDHYKGAVLRAVDCAINLQPPCIHI